MTVASARTRLSSVEAFKRLARQNGAADAAVAKLVETEVQADGADGSRVLRFVISSRSVDRDNDTIDPAGWDFGDWMQNPVVLWMHDSYSPPIARGITIGIDGDRVVSSAEFAPREVNALADSIFQALRGGFLKGASVGFKPLEWAFSADRGDYAIDFRRQKLLEWSVVTIPSNADSLVGAKSAGIDLAPFVEWCEKLLDGEKGPGIWMPRETLERTRAVAANDPVTATVPAQIASGIAVSEVGSMSTSATPIPASTKSSNAAAAMMQIVDGIVGKRGRVLSQANENLLRDAVEGIEKGLMSIEDVLDQVDSGEAAIDPGAAMSVLAEIEERVVRAMPVPSDAAGRKLVSDIEKLVNQSA